MSEHKPKIDMSHELADSSKEPILDNEKEQEYRWVTPAEVRTKLDNISRDKYIELYNIMKTSYEEKKLTKEQFDLTVAKLDELSEKELGYRISERFISREKAKEILGSDCLGPEEVEKAFGVKLEANDIPLIPFNVEELERAKELNQMLILRTNKASDGSPLTMQKINDSIKTADKRKILHNVEWYKDEEFYKSEKPEAKWALVSKEIISESTEKNYLEQTDKLIEYLQNQVFKDKLLPKEYQEAIKEYLRTKEEITKIMKSDWKKAALMLEGLKITEICRQSPAEALYDLILYFQTTGERLLPDKWTWTKRRASGGSLVGVGYFDADGADVPWYRPGYSLDYLGVCFSRKK